MPGPRNLAVAVSSRVCVLCALFALIVVVGIRAQDAQGAGSSPAAPSTAPDPATAPRDAKTPTDDSAATPPNPGTSKTAPSGSTATPTVSTSAAQAKPTLADFAWLAGRWQGAWGPRIAQQVWMPPKGGVMLGVFQTVDNGDTLVLELFTIVETPGGINLYVRHFTPTLQPWEASKATLLKLAGETPKAIEFDNPVNGQPKRQIIRKIDADTYASRAEIVPDKGDTQIVEIIYHRQKVVAPAKH